MNVRDATVAELAAMKAADTPEGQSALRLAEALDSGTALVAAPAMAKQLLAVLDVLRDRRPVVKSDLDKIRDRRARRKLA